MSVLHAACERYASGQLEVGDGQNVYWETIGNPTGVPVVYLHGGPGSGSTPFARRYFDAGIFRAVLFDQRGCGRSRPRADDPAIDLSVNTTDHLVADIERLREELAVDRWIVVGISCLDHPSDGPRVPARMGAVHRARPRRSARREYRDGLRPVAGLPRSSSARRRGPPVVRLGGHPRL